MNATEGIAPEASNPSAFPWEDVLALGLRALRWTPRDFWAATPRELAAAAGLSPHRAVRRLDFARLLAAYPDP